MKNSTKLSLIAAAVGGLMAGATARASTPAPAVSGKAVVSTKAVSKSVSKNGPGKPETRGPVV